jgi:hypothetical protein
MHGFLCHQRLLGALPPREAAIVGERLKRSARLMAASMTSDDEYGPTPLCRRCPPPREGTSHRNGEAASTDAVPTAGGVGERYGPWRRSSTGGRDGSRISRS